VFGAAFSVDFRFSRAACDCRLSGNASSVCKNGGGCATVSVASDYITYCPTGGSTLSTTSCSSAGCSNTAACVPLTSAAAGGVTSASTYCFSDGQRHNCNLDQTCKGEFLARSRFIATLDIFRLCARAFRSAQLAARRAFHAYRATRARLPPTAPTRCSATLTVCGSRLRIAQFQFPTFVRRRVNDLLPDVLFGVSDVLDELVQLLLLKQQRVRFARRVD
jgi:hypothetical protein